MPTPTAYANPDVNDAPVLAVPPFTIVRASTDSNGAQATGGPSQSVVFSPDGGRIAFSSRATNLVAGDTNGDLDVFVKDLTTGVVTRASTNASGVQTAAGPSDRPMFSADGTKIAFDSNAADLVSGDTNGQYDAFVKDLVTGAVTRVSTGGNGNQATGGWSSEPSFSPDGTFILFESSASNLVAGDTNNAQDLFIKDLTTGAVTRVSTSSSGAQANKGSYEPVLSPDGRKIAFLSDATNLTGGSDVNGTFDLFVKDLVTGTVVRLSSDGTGAAANGATYGGQFSADGSKFVFQSYASNLVAGDTNGSADVFLKDFVTGTITRVSTNAAGAQLASGASGAAISPDGTKVAFASTATNLPGANGAFNIFVKDLVTGALTLVTRSNDGLVGTGAVGLTSIVFSRDGTRLAFDSLATNLVPGDTNNQADVFVVTLGGLPVTYLENGAPIAVAPGAIVSDVDNATFAGGSLTVALSDAMPGDHLALRTSTTPGRGVEYDTAGGTVRYDGTVIGSSADGMAFALNGNATPAVVAALIQAFVFSSSSDNPTAAARSVTFTLVDGGGTANGGHDTTTLTRAISVVPLDDQAVANPDAYGVGETGTIVGANVRANDTDVDGTLPLVAVVDGAAANVGVAHRLASGALLTMQADGTFRYDPDGAFGALAAGATGTDRFTYTLADGATATATITVTGIDTPAPDANGHINGTSGDDTYGGTTAADYFDLSAGGVDTVSGGAGADAFFFGAALTGADHVTGGSGVDQVGIQGDYTGTNRLVLTSTTFTNVELLATLPGYSYDIRLDPSVIGDAGTFTVFGTSLAADNNLTVDGSSVAGPLTMYGGLGTDALTGGGGDDGFYFGPGRWGGTDVVHGGGGANDQLGLDGNYTVTLDGRMDVEVVALLSGSASAPNTFNVTVADSFVEAGGTRTIFGLQVLNPLTINASGEHDGHLRIFGGTVGDTITGGDQSDTIFGGSGGDILRGGGGADVFVYDNVSQSTSRTYDTLADFDYQTDRIQISGQVHDTYASVSGGRLNDATFDADLQAAVGTQLRNGAAVFFTPTSGNHAGETFLVVDANGAAGYQAGGDYVFHLASAPPAAVPDFIIA